MEKKHISKDDKKHFARPQQRHNDTPRPKSLGKPIAGRIRNIRGLFAYFVSATDNTEIEISIRSLGTAMAGDEVELSTFKGREGKLTGEVAKVTKRAKTQFVGTIELSTKGASFIPDDKKLKGAIHLVRGKGPEVKNNDKVIAHMVKWTPWPGYSEAEVVRILGVKGDNSTEMNSLAIDRGFDVNFPEEVAIESHAIFEANRTISQEEIAKRRDMRDTLTCTIDPKTAKDFDDAISFKKLDNGNFEIGVHIADVSHYVREKTELDREAFKRGCSVYLPDRTVPMLPFELSDELCSLNENQEKLAFSAIFELDVRGHVHSRWFGKTIIKSAKRFSYESAQETIDNGGTHAEELRTLNEIAKVMRKEKWKKGAIDFEQDEIAFELDETGKPIRIYKKQRLDTHKLVEEYMLLANKEVAEFVYKHEEKSGAIFPLPYRIHDLPNKDKIAELAIFVHALGHELNIGKNGTVNGKDLQALFAQVEGKAEETLVKTAAIRSMAKAIYSTKNIGHFGLAFEYYAHFTSPIRRYPDMLVHRMLENILAKHTVSEKNFAYYERACEHSTEQEIKAAEAERDGRKYKQVEYMQDKVGQTFDGLITGVTEWGIYAEDSETRAEGMIKLASLTDDTYMLDQKNYCIVGTNTKKKYSLGQKIKIKLIGCDLDRKTMDYEIVNG